MQQVAEVQQLVAAHQHSIGADSCGNNQPPKSAADETVKIGPFLFHLARLSKMELSAAYDPLKPQTDRDRSTSARRALASSGRRPTSSRKGVNLHARSNRWEAHIWDGHQVHLGCFETEMQAAVAYDLIALRLRGPLAKLNFDVSHYEEELPALQQMSREDLLLSLRRSIHSLRPDVINSQAAAAAAEAETAAGTSSESTAPSGSSRKSSLRTRAPKATASISTPFSSPHEPRAKTKPSRNQRQRLPCAFRPAPSVVAPLAKRATRPRSKSIRRTPRAKRHPQPNPATSAPLLPPSPYPTAGSPAASSGSTPPDSSRPSQEAHTSCPPCFPDPAFYNLCQQLSEPEPSHPHPYTTHPRSHQHPCALHADPSLSLHPHPQHQPHTWSSSAPTPFHYPSSPHHPLTPPSRACDPSPYTSRPTTFLPPAPATSDNFTACPLLDFPPTRFPSYVSAPAPPAQSPYNMPSHLPHFSSLPARSHVHPPLPSLLHHSQPPLQSHKHQTSLLGLFPPPHQSYTPHTSHPHSHSHTHALPDLSLPFSPTSPSTPTAPPTHPTPFPRTFSMDSSASCEDTMELDSMHFRVTDLGADLGPDFGVISEDLDGSDGGCLELQMTDLDDLLSEHQELPCMAEAAESFLLSFSADC